MLAGLLQLPSELVEEHLLPRLSCRGLGALLLTCKQLRACVAGAALTQRLSEAGRALSKAHPLFTAPSLGEFSARQAAVAAGIAARSTWQKVSSGPPQQLLSFSPDLRHAASATKSQLLVYDWSDAPPTTVQLPPPMEPVTPGPTCPWLRCAWSAQGDIVGWQGPLSAWFTEDLRVHTQCQVFLYRLSTRELQVSIVMDCLLPGQHSVPQPCFLSGGAILHFVAAQAPGGLAALCTSRMGAAGRLHTDTCAVTTCTLRSRAQAVSVSLQGCVAFMPDDVTLCLWRPGYLPRTVKLQNFIVSATFSPCGDLLILVQWPGLLSFVDSREGILSTQQLLLQNYPPVWAPQGVLLTCSIPEQCSVDFYAVLEGPALQLQHRFMLADCTRLSSRVSLSTDHFAICVVNQPGHSGNMAEVALYVFQTPLASPTCSEVQVTHASGLSPGAVLVSQDARLRVDSTLTWLPDGSALLCNTPLHDTLIRFCE